MAKFQLLQRNCEVCGKPFIANKTKNPSVCCSPECKRVRQLNLMWRAYTCVICGKVFQSQNKNQPTCSMECSRQLVSMRQAAARQRQCEICGTFFVPPKPSSPNRTCSIKCGKELLHITNIKETLEFVESQINQPAKEWLEREYLSRAMKDIIDELGIGHPARLRRLMEYLEIRVRTKAEEQELVWKTHPELFEKHSRNAVRINQQMSLSRPTSIEKKMMQGLDDAQINYEFQGVIDKKYPCDFVLRDYMLVVECDGTYWHSKPEAIIRDARKDAYLQAIGWTVLRFSDKIINKDIYGCIKAIQNLIHTH